MKTKYESLNSDEKQIIENLYEVSIDMDDKNGDKMFEIMEESLKEINDELEELSKISGKLNGMTDGGPVSLSQTKMNQMNKANWIIENKEAIKYRFNMLNEHNSDD